MLPSWFPPPPPPFGSLSLPGRDDGLVLQPSAQPSCSVGKGKSSQSRVKMSFGYCLVKGRTSHPMEDFHVSKFIRIKGKELGLFAIFDGHSGDGVPAYLQKNLFTNILKEVIWAGWMEPLALLDLPPFSRDGAAHTHFPAPSG